MLIERNSYSVAHVPFVLQHNNNEEKGKTRGGICAKSGNVESSNNTRSQITLRGVDEQE